MLPRLITTEEVTVIEDADEAAPWRRS